MKTKAEEILIKKYGCKDIYDLRLCCINECLSLSMILDVMEEYRQETIREAKEILLSQTLMTRLHVNSQPIEMIPMAVARDLESLMENKTKTEESIDIESLDISIRLKNLLKSSNITDLRQVCNFDIPNFYCKRFGKNSITELEEVMEKYGLKFKTK